MTPDPRLALVTGAAQGIGKAIARALAQAGYLVAVSDVQPEVSAVAQELSEAGSRAAGACFDVADPSAVRAGISQLTSSLGRGVDVLVNNAGLVTNIAPVAEMAFDAWQRELSVNLTGAFNCIQAVLPGMVERKFGRIVNISSIAAWSGLARQVGYSATKAGLLGLTRTVALEHARHGITCNAVLPGLIATERVGAMPEEIRDRALRQIPARRLGDPAEIAAAVRFLASGEAAYLNGAEVPVDGGMHLHTTSLGSRRDP
ncbi:MAG TPA: SDR family NAD(P)-dependent oxidoreductase [Myxococcales bacterium]|nr:SDR family NAD(P)-dependent oxidoreductase [Myxococcales bacterium]